MKTGRVISLVNQTSLNQLKALLSLAKLVVGTDTGPTHMAAAFQTPVLCISPTKFVKSLRWGPWMTPNVVVNQHQDCPLVCFPYRCQRLYCLDALSVDYVFREAQYLLDIPSRRLSLTKDNWFKASLSVGFYFDSIDLFYDTQWLSMLDALLVAGIRCVLFVAPTINISDIPDRYSSFTLVRFRWFRMIYMANQLAIHDIGIIHFRTTSNKNIWDLICLFAGLRAYVPPSLVSGYKKPKDLLSFYKMSLSEEI